MRLYWRIITDGTPGESRALALAQAVLSALPNTRLQRIEPYPKFAHSYVLELIQQLPERPFRELTADALLWAERIAMPWVHLMIDSEDEMLELVFDRSKQTLYQRPEFEPIRWISISLEHD